MLDTSQFTGTSTWWRHPLNLNVTYTDGAKYVAEKAGAYWLLDLMALNPYKSNFQCWKLSVKDNVGIINIEDGDENPIADKTIEYTDFPSPGITLWLIDNVILVPSEY